MHTDNQTTVQKSAYTGDIPSTPLGYFWFVSKPSQHWMWGAIAVVTIATIGSQSTAYFFKLIVDAVEAGDNQAVLLWVLLYPVAVFVVQLVFRLSGLLGRNWAADSRKYGYDELSRYVMRHSHTYFSDRFAGSILSKINNVVNGVDSTIPEFLWTHLTALVSFLVTLAFIVNADPSAGLVFVILLVVLMMMNQKFAPEKARRSRASAEANTALRGRVVDSIANVSTVRQYTRYQLEDTAIQQHSDELWKTGMRNWGYTEFMLFWNSVVLFLFSLLMFWLLAQSWQAGNMSTGDFVLILSLYAQITGTLIFIGRAFNSTARAFGEMQEGLDDLIKEHEITDQPNAMKLAHTEGTITWNNVTFEYGNNQVFNDFSLRIEPDQKVGLVGPSGAGKTTFVSLLLRQHDIQSGTIAIDGQNIAEVTQDSLREAIAVVPQEPMLFHRSIYENIAYGNPHATEAMVIEVAQKAQAHDFITALPEGYDTLVGERGVKLSGGQKQRVAIARAMLKNAPILILDEATSALDSESEVAIQKALHELMEGKTVVAVAHRLSTLREMDRILVLEGGKIVEDGTHTDLATAGGTYQKLWEHQAGGFLQE